MKHYLFTAKEINNSVVLWGRALIYLVFVIWGVMFFFHPVDAEYIGQSFLHNINLVFHEAGHIIFRPFGRFIMVLGGSLGQLLIPAIVTVAFVLKNRDPFGGSIGLWWLGQNFMDIAPYVNDARDLNLILLGGVTGKDVVDYHDWEYLLNATDLILWDHTLAWAAQIFGMLLMLAAFAWGGHILAKQSKPFLIKE